MADPDVERRKECGLNAVSHLLALRGQLGEAEDGHDLVAQALYYSWPDYQEDAKCTLKAGIAANYDHVLLPDSARRLAGAECLGMARKAPLAALPRVLRFVQAAHGSLALRETSGAHHLFVASVERINLRMQENR